LKGAISYDLHFREKVIVTDAISGKLWNNIDFIPIKMGANDAKFMIVKKINN